MTLAEADGVALFDRLRAGDPTALEPLMDRYASRVYRVANGICASSADAEEVVQDVFLTLFRKAASFEGRAALGTWLYRIAVNSSLNRRRGKRAQLEEPLEDVLPTFLEDGHRSGDSRSCSRRTTRRPPPHGRAGAHRAPDRRHPALRDGHAVDRCEVPRRHLPRVSCGEGVHAGRSGCAGCLPPPPCLPP